jgi:hypothetical protein
MKLQLIALAVAVTAAACIELTTDTSGPLAIEFAPLPYPAVVQGDTLRGPDGAVRALAARVLDGEGEEIEDAPINFGLIDSLDLVDSLTPDGRVFARADTTGTAEFFVTSGSLQSNSRPLFIVPKPDTFSVKTSGRDTLSVSVVNPDLNIASDTAFNVLLRSSGTATTRRPVQGFIVSFELEYRGAKIPPTDTSHFYLMHVSANRLSMVDTTDGGGLAARRIRYRLQPGQLPALDTLHILANVSYRGAPVTGSPVRMMLFIRPR